MKRFASLAIMMAIIVGLLPAAQAAEPNVTWYEDAASIWRLYGTDRMLLERDGGNALSPQASCTVEQAILLVYRAAK